MSIPNDRTSILKDCENSAKAIVLGFNYVEGPKMPLLTPTSYLNQTFLKGVWLKYLAECDPDVGWLVDHIPNPILLLSREAHYNLLRQYRADEIHYIPDRSDTITQRISLGNFIHIPREMPRYSFIAGQWILRTKEDGADYASAQYEDALLWDQKPENRWLIRHARVAQSFYQP